MRLRIALAIAALVSACTLVTGVADLDPSLDGNGGAGPFGVEAGPAEARPDAPDAPDGLDAGPGDGSLLDGPLEADSGDAGAFHDGFERADADVLGNGWTEKTAGAFALSAGRVVKAATATTSYRDNMVYRPAAEDTADVEASIEMTVDAAVQYPQLFVRAQRATIATANTYDGYLLYVANNPASAVLGRQRGTVFVVTLATITIDPPLDPAQRYRLRLAARGTSPVALDAWIERLAGASWIVDGEAHVMDADALRIESAGAVGFSANEAATPIYDDFRWRPL